MKIQPIQIIIADDHAIYRNGLKLLLENQTMVVLTGEASNGEELYQLVDKLKPDVVITDIKMPIVDGIEATRVLKKIHPNLAIIALTMFNEEDLIVEMLEAGALGYLLKNTNQEELLDAVKTVYEGEAYYCDATSQKLTRLIGQSQFNPYAGLQRPKLSPREVSIIKLICKQFSNKEIAAQLGLSVRTVESYREQIFAKIKSRNMIGIVIFAIKYRYVDVEDL